MNKIPMERVEISRYQKVFRILKLSTFLLLVCGLQSWASTTKSKEKQEQFVSTGEVAESNTQSQQESTIKGKVVDSGGIALPGA